MTLKADMFFNLPAHSNHTAQQLTSSDTTDDTSKQSGYTPKSLLKGVFGIG